uniref:Disease resistance protein At4g27190-like leucine-rich repeats domain-containing protein n=1 Tax=Oryza barthii TaxID=65489 RepID=A0A0D3FRW9_9ORYZ
MKLFTKLLQKIYPINVSEAVRVITSYLVDTRDDANTDIYLDGWDGLATSEVLRATAQDPPPDLKSKFSKIIHIDWSRWKSRRALQRTIAEELMLPQWVMAIFNRQDEEEDFCGVDEISRLEIEAVGTEIHQALQQHRCLVLFHNGSNKIIDLHDFGIPQLTTCRWLALGCKILWTFRGRLRLSGNLEVGGEHLKLYCDQWVSRLHLERLLQEETREIAPGITQETATNCCLYLLMLHSAGSKIIDFNWTTHASNYWVCDGIIQGGGDPDQAWKHAAALHREIWLDDYTSNAILTNFFEYAFNSTLSRRWMFVADSTAKPVRWFFVIPGDASEKGSVPTDQSTSFFMANITTIPIDMFHQASKLHVLKLCRCAFSFSEPPFYFCQSLRFLGLDTCKDIIEAQSGEGEMQEQDTPTKNQAHEEQAGEKQERETTTMEFFQKLWVLDICSTDWTIPKNALDEMGKNIREVNIRNGRVWGSNSLAWRRLGRNLHKLRVIEPISNWETGQKDEFMGMAKLELLDLTGNQDIQVLPNLSGPINLKTLVLDGCVGLEKIGPQGLLPPSVESFNFDVGSDTSCKILKISLQGCKHLEHFKLRGTFPVLEELDLSRTSIKKLDLSVVDVPKLECVFLMGCKQMRAVLWWPTHRNLKVLRIDTIHGSSSSCCCLPPCIDHQMKYDAIVITGDARFIQSLCLQPALQSIEKRFYLNLHKLASSCSINKDKGRSSIKKNKIGIVDHQYCYYEQEAVAGGALMVSTSSINASLTEGLAAAHDHDTMLPWSQPLDRHVEIGQGVSVTNVESPGGIRDIYTLLTGHTDSLHVHDNSSITSSVIPKLPESARKLTVWELESCCIQRCPKLQAVFASFGSGCHQLFERLETILVDHLLRATCIWSKGIIYKSRDNLRYLKSVHVCFCPRLKFVLPLSEYTQMLSLEILHVISCGDLRHIFPDEDDLPEWRRQKLVHYFPSLKRIYLHDLPSLEQVCESKMCAPALETITMRGCKSIRHLPALIDHPLPLRPVVNCEKDVWDSLEWDGLDAGNYPSLLYHPSYRRHLAHHPSLFDPRHPTYYRTKLPRGSLLF